jgi:predicted glycosyltransferase
MKGLTDVLIQLLIDEGEKLGFKIFISFEGEFFNKFDKYKLSVRAKDMHHILAFASLLVSDSQSMSVEAAMLGTPSIRFSSFAGKISVLQELEDVYKLTFGIDPDKPNDLFRIYNELLRMEDLKEIFLARRERMLQQNINVTKFLVWFIENYPASIKIMKTNPEYQYCFK